MGKGSRNGVRDAERLKTRIKMCTSTNFTYTRNGNIIYQARVMTQGHGACLADTGPESDSRYKKKNQMLGMVVCAYDPGTHMAEAGELLQQS